MNGADNRTPLIEPGSPAVVVAPMEGVTDAPMRELLTAVGGFSFCVTEFFRISQDIPKPGAFRRHVPELNTGAVTASGTPVQVQLLGGNPEKMAESAARAVTAGAQAIDLNFGCPAPTVNRNDGGATLLKYPLRLRAIVEAVRKAVQVPVSAKLRLGWENTTEIHRNAEAAAEGGARWLTIHGRTKEQGYRPPAHWEPIGEIRARLRLPIVANGDIWTLDDYRRCRDVTGCEQFMLGRAALADPWLARAIGGQPVPLAEVRREAWLELMTTFARLAAPFGESPNYALCRLKQWTRMTRGELPKAELQAATTTEEFLERLRTWARPSSPARASVFLEGLPVEARPLSQPSFSRSIPASL